MILRPSKIVHVGRDEDPFDDPRFQENKMKEMIKIAIAVSLVLFLLLGGIGGCMYAYPQYKVYAKRMEGQAVLAEAESSRQVAVREALALKDSAQYKSEAEVIRAQGVANANKIIGDSLKGHDEYLRYLFIDTMHNTKNQVIYVPTEAGLPVLEATRLQPAPAAPQQ